MKEHKDYIGSGTAIFKPAESVPNLYQPAPVWPGNSAYLDSNRERQAMQVIDFFSSPLPSSRLLITLSAVRGRSRTSCAPRHLSILYIVRLGKDISIKFIPPAPKNYQCSAELFIRHLFTRHDRS